MNFGADGQRLVPSEGKGKEIERFIKDVAAIDKTATTENADSQTRPTAGSTKRMQAKSIRQNVPIANERASPLPNFPVLLLLGRFRGELLPCACLVLGPVPLDEIIAPVQTPRIIKRVNLVGAFFVDIMVKLVTAP